MTTSSSPHKIHKVDSSTAKFWKDSLSSKTAIDGIKRDLPIDRIVIPLDKGYEAVLTLVNGDNESGPYVDAVLCEDDEEIQTLPSSQEELVGDYNFCDPVEDQEINLRIELK